MEESAARLHPGVGGRVHPDLLGRLPEEIGWRGFLLDRLLARIGPLSVSIAVAAIWWNWHWPPFLLPGYYARFGSPPGLWEMLAGLLATLVLAIRISIDGARSLLLSVSFQWDAAAAGFPRWRR